MTKNEWSKILKKVNMVRYVHLANPIPFSSLLFSFFFFFQPCIFVIKDNFIEITLSSNTFRTWAQKRGMKEEAFPALTVDMHTKEEMWRVRTCVHMDEEGSHYWDKLVLLHEKLAIRTDEVYLCEQEALELEQAP